MIAVGGLGSSDFAGTLGQGWVGGARLYCMQALIELSQTARLIANGGRTRRCFTHFFMELHSSWDVSCRIAGTGGR